ncbi:hypothetical protein BS50DRAFT_590901 [Corynespora cassiicola Philippines]|uniref:Uncharacterized protein n=1 Tax=Corynespora cassiicola Philippines TaxID=1448308 RepID=A0A2T2NF63_CORCC|nr:hypothetical protein BS50DRAFT_590901 [Corynespora cassiicola Philippines]
MDLDRQAALPIGFLHGAMIRFGQQHGMSITEIIEDEGNHCYSEHKDDDGMGFCDKHRHMEYDERTDYGYFVFKPEEERDETSDMFDEMSDVMFDVDSMATDVEMG